MIRAATRGARWCALVFACAARLPAQDSVRLTFPEHLPINPVTASRTALGAPRFEEPRVGWSRALTLEYASSAENEAVFGARYLIDAEVLRLDMRLSRDIGPSTFFTARAGVSGAYAGWMDQLLDWFHQRIGVHMRDRDTRPLDVFGDTLQLPNGATVIGRQRALFLDDVRLGIGHRYGDAVQGVFTVTLPTGTAPVGFGHRTLSLGVIHTGRVQPLAWLALEGSAGVGFTPTQGALSDYQRRFMASGSASARLQYHGGQSVYGTLFVHSPYYHDTTLPSLDATEISTEFGFVVRTRRGHEWQFALTENPHAIDPSVDVTFHLGYRW